MRTTYIAKPGEVERKWYVVDATDVPLGRLSTVVASVLRGKNKPTFTPNVDTGDFVIVINAEKVALTGRKATLHLMYTCLTNNKINGAYCGANNTKYYITIFFRYSQL